MASAEAAPPTALLDLPAHLLEEVLHQLADVRALAAATASCRLLWALRDGCVSRMGALFHECPVADTLGLKPIVALAAREAYHIADHLLRHLKKRETERYELEEANLTPWEGWGFFVPMMLGQHLPAEALLAMLQRDGSYVSMYKSEDYGDVNDCDTLRLRVPSGFSFHVHGFGFFSNAKDAHLGHLFPSDEYFAQMNGACKLRIEGKFKRVLVLEDASPNALWGEDIEKLEDSEVEDGMEDGLEHPHPDIEYRVQAVPPGLKVDGWRRTMSRCGDIIVKCVVDGDTMEWYMRHVA